MADVDDDLQKIYKHLHELDATTKDAALLQKITDDEATDLSKALTDFVKDTQNELRKLAGKVSDLEKKMPKK